MIDDLVFGISNSVFVSRETVCDEHLNVRAHVLSDVLCQCSTLGIFGMEKTQITVPLAKADDNFFRIPSDLRSETFQLSANIGFVHLNSTVKHGLFYFLHGSTDAVTEIPCSLIGTFALAPNGALELQSAHSLFSFAEKQCSHKPDWQWQVGIIEDGPSQYGELINAGLAEEQFFCGCQFDSISLAAGTPYTFGPAEPLEQFAALFVGREHLGNV
jgi:hypothetical protein